MVGHIRGKGIGLMRKTELSVARKGRPSVRGGGPAGAGRATAHISMVAKA
jgi:hypothetical protein